MKKYLRIIILFFMVIGLSSCAKKEEATNYIAESRIEQDIREYEKIDPKKLKVLAIKKAKEFTYFNKTSVLVNLASEEYLFQNGVFVGDTGFSGPTELIYTKEKDDYKLTEIVMPKDGNLYYDSLKKMARNDKLLMDEIDGYNEAGIAKALAKKAEEIGLKNYQHQIDDIPGIGKDYVLFHTADKNVVEIANLDEYNEKLLTCEESNWTYVDGVRYFINEKIAVKTPVTIDDNYERERIIKDIEAYKKIDPKKSEFVSYKMLSKIDQGDSEVNIVKFFWGNFSLNKGVFSIDSSYETLAKLEYKKNKEDKKLVDIEEASNSLDFDQAVISLLDNEKLAKNLINMDCKLLENCKPYYIDDMVNRAVSLNLQNFIHNSDKIPGFESDIVRIPTDNHEITEIAKKKDVESVKKNLKQGEKGDVDGVIYYNNFGVAVKTKISIEKN